MDKKEFQQVPFPASNNFFYLRLGIFVAYILLSFYFTVILEEKFAQFGFFIYNNLSKWQMKREHNRELTSRLTRSNSKGD